MISSARPFALSAFCVCLLIVAHSGRAQEPGNKPETSAPTATTVAPAPTPAPAPALKHPDNDFWRKHDQQLLTDFGWLGRFHDADETAGSPKPGETRVVFMGDSITEAWHLDQSFPGKAYLNRGISGQTTPQMLVRFRQDVINLKPKAVVILAGTNDLAGNTGPESPDEVEDNLASMAELAEANGIKVVLCSILPVFDYPWQPGLTPAPKIDMINEWVKDYAAKRGYVYVDFHSAMKDSRDGLPPALSKDGVHPLPAGYAIMAPLAQAGIEKALGESPAQ